MTDPTEFKNQICSVINEQLVILDNCELAMIDKIQNIFNKKMTDIERITSLRIIVKELARINREQLKQYKELKRQQNGMCLI